MRRRLPPPPELPTRFRCFEPAEWADPSDPVAGDGQTEDRARSRWLLAKTEWCRANGVSIIDVLHRQVDDKRRAAGWRDGRPPHEDATQT